IYHEKQIGSLCAVHALNNLLQAKLLDEVALAEVAHGLDAQERNALRGTGLESESGNVRADGFFSVQVITSALGSLGLTSTPIGAESVRGVSAKPEAELGFILNRSQHWFTLRRIGDSWFDLNSMQPQPRVLSVSQLGETLTEAAASGYSVFVVRGKYP
ncbi:Machado-joseph disease protein MJD, partial [Pavlovales sp. CCMP2436]